MLRVDSIDFSYNHTPILHGVSFEVPRSCFCALLGRNGAGKTTLLHCLNGIHRPLAGRVELEGVDISQMGRREMAAKVGLVPQEHTDIFPFKVIEVVVMGRTPHLGFSSRPGPEDYLLAQKVLESLGYAHLAERSFNRISGGERRIVLLARALLQTRENLLFDEPTNHLDFHNQHLILSKISRICLKGGARVIATMHDPNLAKRFAHQVVMLKNGRVIAQGPTDQVMTSDNLSEVYDTPTKSIQTIDGQCIFIPQDSGGRNRSC